MGFDPVTGGLWQTENGPNYGDEINYVEPGLNSGWNRRMETGQLINDTMKSINNPIGLVILKEKVISVLLS
jgi:hypothetical protein